VIPMFFYSPILQDLQVNNCFDAESRKVAAENKKLKQRRGIEKI